METHDDATLYCHTLQHVRTSYAKVFASESLAKCETITMHTKSFPYSVPRTYRRTQWYIISIGNRSTMESSVIVIVLLINYAFDILDDFDWNDTLIQPPQRHHHNHHHHHHRQWHCINSTFGKSLSKLIKWGDYWTICINLYSELVWCVYRETTEATEYIIHIHLVERVSALRMWRMWTHTHRQRQYAIRVAFSLSIDSITHQNLFNIYRICSSSLPLCFLFFCVSGMLLSYFSQLSAHTKHSYSIHPMAVAVCIAMFIDARVEFKRLRFRWLFCCGWI